MYITLDGTEIKNFGNVIFAGWPFLYDEGIILQSGMIEISAEK